MLVTHSRCPASPLNAAAIMRCNWRLFGTPTRAGERLAFPAKQQICLGAGFAIFGALACGQSAVSAAAARLQHGFRLTWRSLQGHGPTSLAGLGEAAPAEIDKANLLTGQPVRLMLPAPSEFVAPCLTAPREGYFSILTAHSDFNAQIVVAGSDFQVSQCPYWIA